MNIVNTIHAIFLIPRARKHLLLIKKNLKIQPYETLIKDVHMSRTQSEIQILTIVKSYFWAARTIKECRCLPRSIALYQYLKSAGFDVEHKFGVNKQDKKLAAHAWVECQHEPLNEPSDLKLKFRVLDKSQ